MNFANFIIFQIKNNKFLKFYNFILRNKKNKFVLKKMEEIMFRYFNIHNSDFPKPRSFYIWSFDNLYPTQKFPISKFRKCLIFQISQFLK